MNFDNILKDIRQIKECLENYYKQENKIKEQLIKAFTLLIDGKSYRLKTSREGRQIMILKRKGKYHLYSGWRGAGFDKYEKLY